MYAKRIVTYAILGLALGCTAPVEEEPLAKVQALFPDVVTLPEVTPRWTPEAVAELQAFEVPVKTVVLSVQLEHAAEREINPAALGQALKLPVDALRFLGRSKAHNLVWE